MTDGTTTYKIIELCASSDRQCFEHSKEDLIDYIIEMILGEAVNEQKR